MNLVYLFSGFQCWRAGTVRVLLALVLAGWISAGAADAAGPVWTHKVVSGDVVYFAFATPARIERYDMASDQWLPSISLPASPTALAVDANAIVIAYDRSVVTRSLDGSGEAGLINMPNEVKGLLLSPEFFFVVCPTYASPSITSIRRSDRQFIATWTSIYAFGAGFAIAPNARRLYGINTMHSGGDLDELDYHADGTFPTEYPGYRNAGFYYYTSASHPRTYVSPNEQTLILGAGYVFDAESLVYRTSLAGSFDDMVYYGSDVPVLLRGNRLYAYNNAFLELGSRLLAATAQALALRLDNVYAFSADATKDSGIAAEKVAISSFSSAQPGEPLDPGSVSFVPDNVIDAGDGTYFVFSKVFQSIFRWSEATRSYTANYPLLGSALYVAYSPTFNRLYTAYSSGQINQIKLDAGDSTEVPFANLPSAPRGLASAGNFILAADQSGSWNTHYTFDSNGTLKASRDWNYYSREYVWSHVQQRMYFFRDDQSPNDLLYEPIDASGQLGTPVDTPYHGEYNFLRPIRLSTDETGVLIGSGLVFAASNLTYAGSLANAITDGVSRSNRWVTIRNAGVDSQIQMWTQNLLFDRGFSIPGYAYRVFNLPGGRLLALTTSGGSVSDGSFGTLPNSGGLVFSIVDPDANTVESSPLIATGPAGKTIFEGQSATLTVSATGSGLSYQWRKAGQPIVGATGTELTVSNAQASDSGNYSVVVSNSVGSIVSAGAVLNVEPPPPPPVITGQPLPRQAFAGGSVWFDVYATGELLSYQWRKGGVAITGATTYSLHLAGITAVDYGDYDVVVSNPGGAVTSDTVSLSVPPAPTVLTHPVSSAANLGSTVWLSVSASGWELSFQWRKDGAPLPGRNSYYLNLGPITAADYASYDCVISNPSGSVTTEVAVVSEPVQPSIVAQPAAVTAVIGGSVTYSISVSGPGPFTYQWRRNGANIAGATGATFTLNDIQATQGGEYSVVVTNAYGSVTSSVAALTIDTTPRLINLSCRAIAGSGGNTLVAGFFVSGSGSKTVLIRGIGPKLLDLNVPTAVADPKVFVYKGDQVIGSNDDWEATLASDFGHMGAFALETGSKDAALKITLEAPGSYTVHLVNEGAVAEGLIEIYDLSRDLSSRLTNISCRLNIGAGKTVILGTYLLGGPTRVLARNSGPGVAKYLLDPLEAMADPFLRVYEGPLEISLNDNWDPAIAPYFGYVGAFPYDAGSKDAAIRVPFLPGSYTIHASSADNGPGVVLIELYESN